jgi:hypothetical protein
MVMEKIPKPIIYAWLLLSLVLNITGIASILDGFVVWADFFKNAISLYQMTIRGPIMLAVNLIYPSAWPRIPGWVFDIVIVWTSFFLAYRLYVLSERTTSPSPIIKSNPLVIFLLGPLAVPYFWYLYRKELRLAATLEDIAKNMPQDASLTREIAGLLERRNSLRSELQRLQPSKYGFLKESTLPADAAARLELFAKFQEFVQKDAIAEGVQARDSFAKRMRALRAWLYYVLALYCLTGLLLFLNHQWLRMKL